MIEHILFVIFNVVTYSSAAQGLVVTGEDDFVEIYDTTGWVRGEIFLNFYGGIPYVWQGEDSINYRVGNGLLWVNGKIVGVDLNETSINDVESKAGIVAVRSYGEDLIHLPEFPDLLAVQVSESYWGSHDKIADEDISVFTELTRLKILDLGGALVTDSSLVYILCMRNIICFALGYGITDTGLSYIKGMKNLRCLYLTHTSITDEGMKNLRDLTNLRTLILGGCPVEVEHVITDKGITNLSNLTNLRDLDISDANLTDTSLALLAGLTNLRSLDLISTNTTDAGLVHLKYFPNLRSLNLCGNPITDAGVLYITRLKNLEWLNVGFTDITDEGLVELGKLPKLKKLIVWGYTTPLTWEGLDKFRKLRPDCELLKMDFWPD